MLVDVGVFETKVVEEASEVRAKHVKWRLLGRPFDNCDNETTSSVWDWPLPSHWTPTGCPWRRTACRGARLL